jgi:protein-disulfide isomerase
MSQEKDETKEGIEISLDSIAVPGAIIITGLIIASAIFFTNRSGNVSDSDVAGTQQEAQDQPQEEFPQATTTISNSPYLGDKGKAKVAIVEYTDFLCPYCSNYAQDTKPSLISEFVDSGDVIYVVRNLPLDFHGQLSIDIAHASLCINEIGGTDKYFDFYAKAFTQESTETLANTAQELGINMGEYNTCMSENRYKGTIDADVVAAGSAGVQGTPGFVIGLLDSDGSVEGKLIAGAYPLDSFRQIIQEYLK